MLLPETVENEEPAFWSHLGTLGIRGIELERNRIKSERESLSVGTRTLAYENYQTFIAAAECGKDVAKHLKETQEHSVKSLSEKLPGLRDACIDFEATANELSFQRKSTSLVLSKHTRLLEILELPQLAETCVRNSHYEEALELQQYAHRLNKKLGSIPVVSEVVKSVQNACGVMLSQLLGQLRGPITLPACLRVVGYLRRMEVFGERELRLRFLQARDGWLTNLLKTVPNDNPYNHLIKTMELTRVHLFDIVTQYRALFSDDDLILVSPGVNPSSNRLLFSAWLEKKISNFLQTLKADLSNGAKNQSIDSIISQAMYFGQSFGRIGADFRLALVPIFTEALRESSLGCLKGADEKFRMSMYHLALKTSVKKAYEDQTSAGDDSLNPPTSLLEFQPLAELCNSILNTLNELRLVAPISLGPEIIFHVQRVLESSAETIRDRESQLLNSSTTDTERAAFQKLVLVFSNDLMPYVAKCLSKVFPDCQQIGLSKNCLQLDEVRKRLPLQNLVSVHSNRAAGKETVPEQRDEQALSDSKTEASPFVVDRASLVDEALSETLHVADSATS